MKPDIDKILYYTNLCKAGKLSLVDMRPLISMYKYILNYKGNFDYSVSKRRLEYIFEKTGIKEVIENAK